MEMPQELSHLLNDESELGFMTSVMLPQLMLIFDNVI